MPRAVEHPYLGRLAKPLGLAVALLALAFLLQVTPHNHANGQDEAACALCQVAHIGSTPAISTVTLSAPLELMGFVSSAIEIVSPQSFARHSSSRGPPASNIL